MRLQFRIIAGSRVRITLGPLLLLLTFVVALETRPQRLPRDTCTPQRGRVSNLLPTMNLFLRLTAALLAAAVVKAASLSVQNTRLTVTGADASQLRSES